MDIINIIIFSLTALLVKGKGVGTFCLCLVAVTFAVSDVGPLGFLTNEDFFLRHILGEVILAIVALEVFGIKWRGLCLVLISMITSCYFLYEYFMWDSYTATYQYHNIINSVLFELIVLILWLKSPIRNIKNLF